jgi:transcription termination/antitermination protein NusG
MSIQAVLAPATDLFEAGQKLNTAHWFALYTKSRHEKLVDRELTKKGLETFLPLRKITRHWSDRKKIIEDPLFKGYLFVRLPLKERWTVLNTVGAVRFIGRSAADPTEVPERELQMIRKFIESEIQVDPFPYLKEGQRVYLRSGPFKGMEGFIVRKDRHCRLVISLDVLMKSVSIVVDEACLEPL